MIFDDLQPGEVDDAGEEKAALEETRQAMRARWFCRFAVSERRHSAADAWAMQAEARSTSPRRGVAPLSRLP